MPGAYVCVRLVVVVLLTVLLSPPPLPSNAWAAQPAPPLVRNERAEFSLSLVPAVPVPIRIGTRLGFRLSSTTAGYANLYLIDPLGAVSALAENFPLAAGSLEYPSSAEAFTLAAGEPVGFNRVILFVTRQPFDGFAGSGTLTRPVSLALRAGEFLAQLNRAAASLPPAAWATDEIRVRVVG